MTENCDMHVLTHICTESGQPASAYCPAVETGSILLVRSNSYLAGFEQTLLQKYLPHAVYSDITIEEYDLFASTTLCPTHAKSWSGLVGSSGISGGTLNGSSTQNLALQAATLLSDVDAYLQAAQNITDTDRTNLITLSDALRGYLDAGQMAEAQAYYDRLKYSYEVIYQEHPPVTAVQ